jgi:hypothetical protein
MQAKLQYASDMCISIRVEIGGGYIWGELYQDSKDLYKWHVMGTDAAMPFDIRNTSVITDEHGCLTVLVGVRPCNCGSGLPNPGSADGCVENTEYCG